jgi:hypothetical protein
MGALVWRGDPLVRNGEPLTYGEDTMATYLPRIAVHPDRYGSVKTTKNLLIVIHTSEGSEGVTSATNLANYMKSPGDRQNDDGSFYGSSYQYVTDLNQRIIPCVPDHTVSYSAAGANHNGIHICIPGRAGQTRAQWLDSVSRQYIESAAAAAIDISKREGIPLVRLSTFQVAAGRSGYCGHVEISQAFKRSDHTDPGTQFPWDVFAADIARLSGDDDMQPLDVPDRVYDSRVTGGQFAAGEVRRIPVGMCTKAFLHITAVGSTPGYVSISGTDQQSPTSLVNFDTDHIESDGAPIGVPDGHVRVFCSAPADIIVDVYARG